MDKQTIKEHLAINIKFFAYYFHEETNGIPFRDRQITTTYKKWLEINQPLVYECLMEVLE